jgi:hypothetical protein
MAKKAVASLQDKSANKKNVKCIKMIKEGRNDSYVFKEEMVPNEEIKNFFGK